MLLHIAHWAKDHRLSARLVIVLTRIIFLLVPIILGLFLWQPQMMRMEWLNYSGAALFFLGIALFPKGIHVANFYQRVGSHALMTVGYIGVLFYFGLDLARIYEPLTQVASPVEARTVALGPAHNPEIQPSLTTSLLAKPLKWLYQKSATFKKEASTGSKAGAIIFGLILIFLGLLLFSAASCGLSCGIADTSTVMMLLMSIAIIVGGIFLIIVGVARPSQGKKSKTPIVPDDSTIQM